VNRTSWLIAVMALMATSAVSAAINEAQARRLTDAATVVRELRSAPDTGIPETLWQKASCVAVIPSVKKAAFIFGGEYGKGLISCRTDADWSAPSFLVLQKGSFGLQIGGTTIDLVLLVMNPQGIEKLLRSKVALGAEASVAAGPVGRDVRALTDAQLRAEILSYSRAQGVFAGLNLAGGVLKADEDDNRDAYGKGISARDILVLHTAHAPNLASAFLEALRRPGH
jgi:lipid-binding SYLF domain-containing protein